MIDKNAPLRPELKFYFDRLQEIFERTDWPNDSERVRELKHVGSCLDKDFGYSAMVNVCDNVRRAGNVRGALELEGHWDHIGEWRR